MEGYILLHRKIIDNPYYFSERFTRSQAWIDLLLIANHKDGLFYKRGVKVEIKRGQVGYGSETLAERWQWSRGKVLRFLNELENDKQIVQQKSNVINLISISNYNTYQINGTTNRTANSTTDSTTDGTQIVQQTDTNNKRISNVNNDKKVKEENFIRFWNLYPNKISRSKCEYKFLKLSIDVQNKILETLPKFLAHKPFETYHHPNPETYLNQKRWEDEIPINGSAVFKPEEVRIKFGPNK